MKKFLLIVVTYSLSFIPALSQGLWSPRASLPDTARGYGIGFSIGNYGYVGLGYDFSIGFHDLWQFNPSTNTWVQKAIFPGKATTCPAIFVIGHKAFVVGGADNPNIADTCYKQCWEYDATIDKWTQKGNFPGVSRAYAVGFAIGGKGYVGTGYDSSYNLHKDFWQYDTATDVWTRKADFGGSARFIASGFAVGSKGYVCFGQDTSIGMNVDMWEYDTGTDAWTKKSNCPGDSVYGASGFVIGSNIYVGTGQDGLGNYYNTFWEYNTLSDSWSKETNFMGAVRSTSSTSFAIGDSGYMGLGVNTDIPISYNDWYKFYPDTVTGINELKGKGEEISVFPNPSDGVFTIKNEELGVKNTIEVYNILGEKVFGETLSQNQSAYNINLSNMTTGIYTLKVYSSTQTFNKKLLIIH